MSEIVKLALYQLNGTPKHETVKVAGIVRRLKNWIKGKLNSEFGNSILELKTKSEVTKNIIDNMESTINLLQEAISDGDLESYESQFDTLKGLSAKLISEIQKSHKEINKLKTDQAASEKAIKPEIAKQKYYKSEDMKAPEFMDKFKAALPSNYDIPLNTLLRNPLKSFGYYANIDPNSIFFSPAANAALFKQVMKAVFKVDTTVSVDSVDPMALVQSAQNSIANGTLVQANAKVPSKEVTKQQIGFTELEISSAPFSIPGTNLIAQAEFIVVDRSTALSGIKRLSVKASGHIGIIGKTASLTDQWKKIAEQIPYKTTTFSDLEFANIMRKGYQLAFGSDPSLEVLAGGWAQATLESGRPVKLPNNNVGNIKATPDWIKSGKPYFTKSTGEFTSDGKPFVQTDAAWRAYATPEEGAAGYWHLIGSHFPEALKWMAAGDPISAAVSLGQNHYFTANIDKYSHTDNQLYKEFFEHLATQMPDLKSDPQAAPGPKPEVKQWNAEYKSNKDNDLDNLVHQLVASSVSGLVKQAMIKELLPENKALLRIKSNNTLIGLEYTRKLAHILQKYCLAKTSIYKDDNNIDLEVKLAGSPEAIFNTIGAISDDLADKFAIIDNIKVIIAPNISSDLNHVTATMLYQNAESFNKFAEIL